MFWGFGLAICVLLVTAGWVAHRSRPRANRRQTKKAISRLATSLREFHRAQRATPARPPVVPGRTTTTSSSTGRPSTSTAAPRPPAATPSGADAKLRFISTGQSVLIGDLHLASPLIYIAEPAARSEEPSAVDPTARIIGTSQQPAGRLPPSPRYDDLTPMQRHAYLKWIATGRAAAPADPGFALLYLYGLERRLLIDKTDARQIAEELLRQIPLQIRLIKSSPEADDPAFTQHAVGLLMILLQRFPDAIDPRKIDALLQATPKSWRDELPTLASWMIGRKHPITTASAWPIAMQLPDSQKAVVVERLHTEMRSLLQIRFTKTFPQGLLIQGGLPTAEEKYKPANPWLSAQRFSVPDPAALAKTLQPLSDLWNQCIADLRRLSTIAARTGDPLQKWSATPEELRAGRSHPLRGPLNQLLRSAAGQFAVIQIEELAKLSSFDSPKLSLAQSRELSQAITDAGFAIEPDANLTGRSFRPNQFVTVFRGPPLASVDPTSAGYIANLMTWRSPQGQIDRAHYEAAASVLRIALAVAAIDGIIKPAESAAILKQLRTAFDLSDTEQTRIAALHAAMLREPLESLVTGQPLKKLAPQHRQSIGRLVLAVIAADGPANPEKLTALKKTCTRLGFEKTETDQLLAPLLPPESTESKKPDSAEPTASQPIPALNRTTIDAIFRDTRQVAQLLADAMSEKDENDSEITGTGAVVSLQAEERKSPDGKTAEETAGPVETMGSLLISSSPEIDSDPVSHPASPIATAPPTTLPAQYIPLYDQLITRPEWPIAEAQSLARQHGLMLAGALDAINDWSQDHRHGQLFFEEEAKLVVDQSLPPPA